MAPRWVTVDSETFRLREIVRKASGIGTDGGANKLGTADASAAFNAVIAGGEPLSLAPGATYRLDAPIATTGDLIISSEHATIIRNFDGPIFDVQAAWPAAVTFTSATEGTYTFPGSSTAVPAVAVDMGGAHTFAVGDTVRLISDDLPIGGTINGANQVRTAQFFTVGDVSGNTLYLPGLLLDPFTTQRRIVKVPDYVVDIDGVTITDAVTATAGLGTFQGVRPRLRNVRTDGVPTLGFTFIGCRDMAIDVDMIRGSNLGGATPAYAVRLIGCEGGDVKVTGRQFRHLVTTLAVTLAANSTSTKHAGRCRDVKLTGWGDDCYGAAFDTHPASYGTLIHGAGVVQSRSGSNSSVTTGVQLRGINETAADCIVDGMQYGYRSLIETAGNGRGHRYENCRAINCDVGLWGRDEFGELDIVWNGGQVDARTRAAFIQGASRFTMNDADVRLSGANPIAFEGQQFPSTTAPVFDVDGGRIDVAASTGAAKVFKLSHADIRATARRTRLVGTFAELNDSTATGPGRLVIGDLDTTDTTITTGGGPVSVPRQTAWGLDWNSNQPLPPAPTDAYLPPTSPAVGQVWRIPGADHLAEWTGSAWAPIAPAVATENLCCVLAAEAVLWSDAAEYETGDGATWHNLGSGGSALDWTMTGPVHTATGHPRWVFDGVDDYGQIADNPLLDFGAGVGCSVLVIATLDTVAPTQALIAKRNLTSTSLSQGWVLAAVSSTVLFRIDDSTANNSSSQSGLTAGAPTLIAGVRDAGVTVSAVRDQVVTSAASTVGDLSNARAVRLGRLPDTVNNPLDGSVYWIAVIPRAVSSTVLRAVDHMRSHRYA